MNVLKLSTSALTQSLKKSAGLRELEGDYVEELKDNLVQGVEISDFEADFSQGDGNELASKMRAAYSSSALAANVFAPFKKNPRDLTLGDHSGFTKVSFEARCPTGLIGRRSPNLDLLAEGKVVVGVESKCTEYLSIKKAKFAPAYQEQIKEPARGGNYFQEMIHLIEEPGCYKHLDAAQLIKHSFGLSNTFKGQELYLFYVYWKPLNFVEFEVFRKHRSEITEFAKRVENDKIQFEALSYNELWDQWEGLGNPWLSEHIKNLKRRYQVNI